ncbi:MAG: MFS transporter, partial [Candidatus Limnocylindrales bacterium]
MQPRAKPNEADDRPWMLLVSFGFSIALGAGTITIPLVALDAGYSPATIGFLAAIAAGIQFAARLSLPPLLGRFPDRVLILGSTLLMALAFGLLIASTALPVFIAAQICQGGARAAFWTSAQTHVIRGASHPVRRLVDLTLAGNAGTL